MGRVRNLVIAALLLAGVGYLGIKGYLYYQVKSSLDGVVAKARPFADIDYGGISSSLSGSVSVEDITVRAFNDEVRVAAVELQTSNLAHLLGAVSDFERGAPPDYLEIGIRSLAVELNGPLMSFAAAALQSHAPRLPAEGNPCGGQLVFGPVEWRAMGYSRLVSNVRMRIDASNAQGGLGVAVESNTDDMGSISLDMRLSGIEPRLNQRPQAENVLLKHFEVVYRDASYTRRVVDYCAQAGGTDAAGYVDSVLHADDRYFMHAWSMIPGDTLRTAYGRYLNNPSAIRVLAAPQSPVELSTLHLYAPEDIVALLDLQVFFNGDAVSRPRFTFRPELLHGAAASGVLGALPGLGSRGGEQAAVATAPRPREKPKSLTFRAVDKDHLGRYIGRTVRIVTTDDQSREGVLMASDRERVVVERRMYGGSMSVPVLLGQIDTAEVLLPGDS